MIICEGSRFRYDAAKAPRLHQGDEALGPQDMVGVGQGILGLRGPTSPGSA